ncbi:MAG TPA: hypothetical protein VIK91_19565, partial [Nannocystis sp.]
DAPTDAAPAEVAAPVSSDTSAEAPADAPSTDAPTDAAPAEVAAPVSSDTSAEAAPAPVVEPDPVVVARRAFLGAYGAILDQIRELAPGDRSDRVAQLAEAAAALVKGDFVQRLVFGDD